MTDDPRRGLQGLGQRIDEARLKRAPKPDPADARFKGEPLTHVFDDWNDEIRRRDDEIGRLHAPQQVALVFLLVAFLLLLNWLWPI